MAHLQTIYNVHLVRFCMTKYYKMLIYVCWDVSFRDILFDNHIEISPRKILLGDAESQHTLPFNIFVPKQTAGWNITFNDKCVSNSFKTLCTNQ